MKRTILYIIFLIILGQQSCCLGTSESEIDMKPKVSIVSAIRMQSNLDTIYKITYPNSLVKFTPNSYSSAINFSAANEYTTMFIWSSKGFDTITFQVAQVLSYQSDKCKKDYVAKTNLSPITINNTFDTCYFIRYKEGNSYVKIFDTLIVN